MLTLFLRAVILYLVMVVVMRAMGRRELGQFQPYEFAMMILLANMIVAPMESVSVPLLEGLLPVMAMYVMYCAITLIGMKSDRLRALISGKPAVVISKGVIDQKQLEKLCLSLSDLLEGLRGAGVLDPGEVGTAIVEANGQISAFPRSSRRPPHTSELGIDAGYEGIPMFLVMDGRVQKNNLAMCKKDEGWLITQLARLGMDVRETFFAFVDTQGVLTAQKRGGGAEHVNAIDPGEVRW